MVSKFGNLPVRDATTGLRFASRAEHNRYQQLRLLERAEEIRGLECQPCFVLFYPWGTFPAIRYYGDFRYWEGEKEVVEDVKGVQTAVFKLKWGIVNRQHPEIEFRIIPAEDCYG